jgi:hypothetical protein
MGLKSPHRGVPLEHDAEGRWDEKGKGRKGGRSLDRVQGFRGAACATAGAGCACVIAGACVASVRSPC